MKKYFLLFLPFVANATTLNNTQKQNIETRNQQHYDKDLLNTENHTLQRALFDKEVISEANANTITGQYTDKELIANYELLEKYFIQALGSMDRNRLPKLVELYKQVPERDESLIEWANAILIAENDMEESIKIFRKLISNFPDNNLLRFQLANALFHNQQYEASKDQFLKLRSATNIDPNDIEVFNKYIAAIDNQDQWNFSFRTTMLNDKNLNNAAKKGTKMTLPNSSTVTYDTDRQKGHGLSINMGVNKQWSLGSGRYISLDANTDIDRYFNNKKYNRVNLFTGVSFGINNPRFSIELQPYVSKSLYGYGTSTKDNGKLHSYYNTLGVSVSTSAWIKKDLKHSLYYSTSYDKYTLESYAKQYDGLTHTLTNSLMYITNPKQYWTFSLDLNTKDAKNRTNAFNSVGGRIGWGQEWPLGMASRASIGVSNRAYKAIDYHGKKQKDHLYSANLSLWHKSLHYKGFTPRLTMTYRNNKSNVAYNEYDKFQAFIEVGKTF